MKERFVRLKRVLALTLAVCILAIGVPFAAFADEVPLDYKASTDPATVNDWKQFFGPDQATTVNAGSVWTDKSVFTSVDEFTAATDENENTEALRNLALLEDESFLVALSAIASSKSVEGFSTLPTDTMLVLDLSASMQTNQAVSATVEAANDAIDKLLNLSAYNRVGVIAYSGSNSTGSYSTTGTAQVILPMGRYTPGQNSQRQPAYLVSSWQSGNNNRTGVKVAPGVTGTVADDVESTFSTNNYKQAEGGTYIQNGLYQAWEQFEAVAETTITEGLQAGVGRVPVMVLLSDGAPTTATTNYTDIGTANSGNGSSTYATPGIAFLTQLTASWVSDKLEEKYNTNPLFYTLGLKVDESDAAQSVLNPAGNTATDEMWEDYIDLENTSNKRMSVEIRPGYWESNGIWGTEWVEPVTRTISYTDAVLADGWSENYVTEYFPASNAAGLINAFEDIVEQIVIQSLYYPTLVEIGNDINEDGFLEFEDYIGKNMEVKAVKGIQLGSKLYTGATLARMIYEGGMGTVENPTDAGNNLVWSVQKRLGIEKVEDARTLIGNAYSNGQLYYNPQTGEYSNYIGWYADENGDFVGFWDGKDSTPAAVPAGFANEAVYAIKSFGYYDAIGDDENHRKTDMMYATIQVRTNLKDTRFDAGEVGDVRVIGRLPASLIPLVEYNIDLDGMDPMDPATMTITGATAPSRLVYEVGLSSKIDLLNIEDTAPDPLVLEDGKYVFYTNQWHMKDQQNDVFDDYSYSTNKNTISYFEPSVENERYYYNADTPIYTDTRGTLYTGASAPTYDESNPYYHRFLIYSGSGNSVKAEWHYEPVSEHVLGHMDGEELHDLKRLDDGSWVVKRGTIYHYYSAYVKTKANNKTATLPVSDMPFVHDIEVGVNPTKDHFHVDSYLGNNGKLLVDPYEGIKITKTVDTTITDRTLDYTFEIDAGDAAFDAEVTLVKENAAGERALSILTFNGGKATVTLKAGEIGYVVGDELIGKTLTVSEQIPNGADYEVASVNGNTAAKSAALEVTAGTIGTAAFVNTKPQNGDVVITKTVISDLDSHDDKEFEFAITLTGNVTDGDSFTATRSDGESYNFTGGQNNMVSLKHNQALRVHDLPAGTVVEAVEGDYTGDGFTVNMDRGTATAEVGQTQYIHFTNTYAADPAEAPDAAITVTKDFDADAGFAEELEFDFQLQKYDAATGIFADLGSPVTVTYAAGEKGEKSSAAWEALKRETYDAAGTYYYRITEVVNPDYVEKGIVYDTTPVYFRVVVSDNGVGELYVSDVLAGTDATVTPGTDSWAIAAAFRNQYAVDGAAEAILNIDKTVKATVEGVTVPESGFEFALYQSDDEWTQGAEVKNSHPTGADGKTEISLLFDNPNAETQYYLLKEKAGTDPRIDYSARTYGVKIDVGHENNKFTIDAEVYEIEGTTATKISTVASAAGTENEVVSLEISGDTLSFTNEFTPDPVIAAPITATKTITGKALSAFTFELVEKGVVIQEKQNNDRGEITFGAISYEKPGVYTYTIREKIPAGADGEHRYQGTVYDPTAYTVTVTVTGNNTTGLLSASAVTTLNGDVADAVFRNRYTVDPVTDVVIEGHKHLEGNIRKLQVNSFYFELLQGNTVIQTVGNGVPTADFDAKFAFAPLTFTEEGTFTFTVREYLPVGVTAVSNKLNGVVYDTNVYPVTVEVTDQGDGTLHAEVQYPTNEGIRFNNKYEVAPTFIDFDGTKTLIGDALSKYNGEKAFDYELYEANYVPATQSVQQGALIESVTDNGTGRFRFDHNEIEELNFNAIGAYRFIIKEQVPTDADPLMNYDTSAYYIEVDVTDDLRGGLKATPTITKVDAKGITATVNEIAFVNELKVEPISVELGGVKSYNRDLTDGLFTFELYQAMEDAEGKIIAIGDPLLEASNKADGSFKFEEKLLTDELSGIQAMSTHMSFFNPGTYHYVIKEKLPEGVDAVNNKKNGVIYDTKAYVVTVEVAKVTDNTGRDVLIYELTADGVKKGTITVTNTYDPADAKVTLGGTKELIGRDLEDGEFTFELYDGANLKESVTNEDDTFTFEEMTFDAAGEYTYTVKEKKGAEETITYDTAVYTVTVKVVDEEGVLLATTLINGKKDGEMVFKNIYTKPEEPPVETPSGEGEPGEAEPEKEPTIVVPPIAELPQVIVPEKEPPVKEPAPAVPVPDTGDHTNLLVWVALLFVSGGLLGVTLLGKKKAEETE